MIIDASARARARGNGLRGTRVFYHFLVPSSTDESTIFNVFRYLTFRTGGALLTALLYQLLSSAAAADPLAANSKSRGSRSATDGPQRHIVEKQGTPDHGRSADIDFCLWCRRCSGPI